jgi:hypothetical protein
LSCLLHLVCRQSSAHLSRCPAWPHTAPVSSNKQCAKVLSLNKACSEFDSAAGGRVTQALLPSMATHSACRTQDVQGHVLLRFQCAVRCEEQQAVAHLSRCPASPHTAPAVSNNNVREVSAETQRAVCFAMKQASAQALLPSVATHSACRSRRW